MSAIKENMTAQEVHLAKSMAGRLPELAHWVYAIDRLGKECVVPIIIKDDVMFELVIRATEVKGKS